MILQRGPVDKHEIKALFKAYRKALSKTWYGHAIPEVSNITIRKIMDFESIVGWWIAIWTTYFYETRKLINFFEESAVTAKKVNTKRVKTHSLWNIQSISCIYHCTC